MINKRRNSNRIPDYDYSQSGYYFVTICTKDKIELFGYVNKDIVNLNVLGIIIEKWITKLPYKYKNIKIDNYVIMPNHIHFILHIDNKLTYSYVGVGLSDPNKGEKTSPLPTLGNII